MFNAEEIEHTFLISTKEESNYSPEYTAYLIDMLLSASQFTVASMHV